MKLMIAIPTMETVPVVFMDSLLALVQHLEREKIDYKVEIEPGTLIYLARDKLAGQAINGGYTHVLWLDSDMVFSEKILEDLMFCGKDMVCGAFVSRRPQYSPCVYSDISDPGNMVPVKNFGTEPFRVDGCGFAAVLTTTSILKAVTDRFGPCFRPTDKYGEDLAFCDRVKQLGREIWCDPTVRPGHIAHIPMYVGNDFSGGGRA